MKKTNTATGSRMIGCLVAVTTFLLLSIFTGGIIEFSRDVGFFPWLRDTVLYAVSYKLGYKLMASLVLGFAAYFVNQMIAYGKMVNAKKRARTPKVHFAPVDSGVGRTA